MYSNIGKKKGYWESFDDIDGLAHECGYLLEDTNGNVWIGTTNGLSRYDGEEFVNFTDKDGLASSNCHCIYQDKDDIIWIGTREGLSRYDGTGFVSFTDKDGLPDNSVQSIHQDGAGNIWIGTGNGLSRYDGTEFVNFAEADGLPGNNVRGICQGTEGNIWIGANNGLSRYDGTRFVNFTVADGLAGNYIFCVQQDGAGNIWAGANNGLSRYDGEEFVNFTVADGLPDNYIWCLCRDREGDIWVGTLGGGASHYDGNKFINFNTEHGLAHDAVFDIMQDREGSLWFACYHAGVSRYNPYEIVPIFDEPVDEVMMQDSSGDLWWGFRSVLSQFDGETVSHYPFEHGVFDVFEDSKGRLWIGTDGGGVFIYDSPKVLKGQEPQNLTVDDGLVNNRVARIYEDAKGRIWIGTRGGLSQYDGEKFLNFTTDDGLGSNVISVIWQDRNGAMLFAGWAEGGITSYDGKSFSRRTTDDGLFNNSIQCIIEDDKNDLWIGTPTGISRYDGESFRNYTLPEDELLGSFVQRIFQDSRRHIWIATLGGGISRSDGRNFQVLTTEDGLPSNCVTGILEDSDGRIVISTYRGICKYVPDFETPPLIRIDEVDADRVYKNPKGMQILESISAVTIKYHGVSFKTKRMRYSYILEGYDEDWTSTWGDEVRYEDLPIGRYTFKVIAINRDMVCSETAEFPLRIIADTRDRVIDELEERVRERTSELQEKNAALEQALQQLREAQDQLIIKEKMASLGDLVAGVAHEINNPTGVIASAADTANRAIQRIHGLLHGEENPDRRDNSEERIQECFRLLEVNHRTIAIASARISSIVQSLRIFTRLDEALFQQVDLHRNIDVTLTLMQHELRDRVTVIKEYGDIPVVQCYPNELNQMFMNLLRNAAQAIEERGTITITTYADATQVYVKISDTGKGIPPEDLPRVYDPGFTRQGAGVGTGLGLSIVYNIVQKHRGDIKIDSKVRAGTTFTIALPIEQLRGKLE